MRWGIFRRGIAVLQIKPFAEEHVDRQRAYHLKKVIGNFYRLCRLTSVLFKSVM
jgi:hypothetical protein